MSDIKTATEMFASLVEQRYVEYYSDMGFTFSKPPSIQVEYGRRYAKLIVSERDSSRSVFGFVDMSNGDVLKAATWRAPAKHPRGNVLSDLNGMEAVTKGHPCIVYLSR